MADPADHMDPALAARLAKAHTFIERNFRRSPQLGEVAGVAHLSEYHFHRLFSVRYGKTVKRLTTELQLAEAQRLMLQGTSIARAAAAVGFANQAHMTNRFKQSFGMPPGKWLMMRQVGLA